MTLEDFEKELAQGQKKSRGHRSHRDDPDRSERSHHHHHHRNRRQSSRDRDSHVDDDGHRSKRSRNDRVTEGDSESRHLHKHHHRSQKEKSDGHEAISPSTEAPLKRDSWMEAPSALDVDYVQRTRKAPSPPQSNSLGANFEMKVHKNELNHHLHELQAGKSVDDLPDDPARHEVDYVFGDAASQWRMTKLKAVYRQAEESGRKVEEVALERFDSLRDFDDAREEEIELGRRETYGKGYVGKKKPSGELFQERKLDAGIHRQPSTGPISVVPEENLAVEVVVPTQELNATNVVDQSALNKMKAQFIRAQMLKDPKVDELERAYNEAFEASQNQNQSDVITLSAMDNRMLSSAPRNEVKAISGKRNQERRNVEENEDMSIEDMVREERRTRGQAGGEGQRFAERIAKDAKFDNDLDYMDENAGKLAKRVHKSEINLRNTAISDFQKVNKILDNCPLCHHEDINTPPVAPVVSLATRTYLTLPTEPELSSLGAIIVPTQHRANLLECDDDEWEEIRNFMKSLTRLYHDQGRDVIFYENAAFPNRRPHAAMNVVPLPYSLGETAPAFFKEAFLTSEDEWSQHKKIIDTLANSKQGLGKLAFRRSLVKEMPYFHVWFELDGGLGHIVEDAARWPKGDLFAREIVGGMLDLEPDVIKRQGRWQKGHDVRVEGFRNKWRKFDWTRVLTES